MKRIKLLAAAAALAVTATGTPAQAVTFVLTSTSAGTAQGTLARQGFEVAALYWSSVLTNNVTVNLNINFSTLGEGILGGAGSSSTAYFNANVYNALAGQVSSSIDASAVASLQPLTPTVYGLTGLVMTTNALNDTNDGYLDTSTRIDDDGSVNNVAINVNKAVAKIFGFTTDAYGESVDYASADGSISFSDAFNFDFDPTDGIAADAIDFVGVAIHEIGHTLGFISGVDIYDRFTGPGTSPGTDNSATLSFPGALENSVIGTSLDLFRYSAPGRIDWSTQNTPYFSVDGGATQLFGDSRMSQGIRNGDGQQASHFKDSASTDPQLGILDPTTGFGQEQEVTALDIAAFDAIGWRTAFDARFNQGYRYTTADAYRAYFAAGVPEPATWLMMIFGFGAIGGVLRRKIRQSEEAFTARVRRIAAGEA